MEVLKILERTADRRKLFSRSGDFARHIYDRTLLRFPRVPLPWRKGMHQARMRGLPHPVFLRYGSTDFVMLSEIFFSGEYEQAANNIDHGSPTIVDLGANAGYSLCYWGQRFPTSRIIAVEPDPSNSGLCRQNIEIAGMKDRATLLQSAVVGRSRPIFLDRSSDECSFHVSDDGSAGPSVTGVTMEDVLARFGVSGRLDLLKCDIEGAEAEVFRDCSQWIRRFRMVVVETHAPYTMEQLVSDLERNGAAPHPISLRDKGHGLGLALIKLGMP